MLVLLADIILFREVYKKNTGFRSQEEERVDDFYLRRLLALENRRI